MASALQMLPDLVGRVIINQQSFDVGIGENAGRMSAESG
ncbi:MAG: hypothetical protein ACI88G_001902 [Woeseiaceae bacterium]|jgi:hypothetical protein